ncbi:putative Ig domain-containing protein [Pseudoalteromonas holothuriae]|uniref:putative Ig domain-containing protein n=1 Tax=Pseudoalteromonas holothuriae TaxID=2963714 RepID=UPI0021C165FA|nr:putative Ig domain-containing protein [Pseudoalteromonas sp. CIP111951]
MSTHGGKPTNSEFTFNTAYNAFGEVKKDDQGVYVYNQEGLLWKTTKGDGVLKTHTYDNAGRLTKTIHALNGTTHIKRDALGNASEIKQPQFYQNGGWQTPLITQKHDRWGNVIEHKDAMGSITKAQYNHQNKVIKELLPAVAITSEAGVTRYERPVNLYHYDAQGNLVRKIDGNNSQQTFSFDANNKQVAHQDGEGHVTRYNYDIHGRRVSTQDALGRVTTSTYDRLDQVLETGQFGVVNGVSDTYRKANQYQYNELGNRTNVTNALGGIKRYQFDALGNVIHSKDEMNRVMEYDYNLYGNQTTERYSTLYTGGQKNQNTRSYNEFGQVQTGNDLGGKNFTYVYGKSWNDTEQTVASLNDSGIQSSRADIGRVIEKRNDHGQKVRYTYYDNGWLKTIKDETTGAYSYFEYDKAGRRILELTQAIDDLQRVMRHQTVTNYDSNGRITLIETEAFKNNKPAGQTPNWVAGNIISRVSYQYDAVGNRRSMSVENGVAGEIAPRTNELKIEPNLGFVRNSSILGKGQLNLTNDYGIEAEKVTLAFIHNEQVIQRPDWLKEIDRENDFIQVDKRAVSINLTQLKRIPSSQQDLSVRVTMVDKSGKKLVKVVPFKLIDNVKLNGSISADPFTEGTDWSLNIPKDLFMDVAKEGLKFELTSSLGGNKLAQPPFVLSSDGSRIHILKDEYGTPKKITAGQYQLSLKATSKAASGGDVEAKFSIEVKDNKSPINNLPLKINVKEGEETLDIKDFFTDSEGDKISIDVMSINGTNTNHGITFIGSKIGTSRIDDGTNVIDISKTGFGYFSSGEYTVKGIYKDQYNEEQSFDFTLEVEPVDTKVKLKMPIMDQWKLERGQQLVKGDAFNVDVIKNNIVNLENNALKFSLVFKSDVNKLDIYQNNADRYDTYQQLQSKIAAGTIRSVANELGIVMDADNGRLSGTVSPNASDAYPELVLIVHEDSRIDPLTSDISIHIAGDIGLSVNEGVKTTVPLSRFSDVSVPSEVKLIGQPSFVKVADGLRDLVFEPSQTAAGVYKFQVQVTYDIGDNLHNTSSTTTERTNSRIRRTVTKTFELSVNVIAVNVAPKAKNASAHIADIRDDQVWSFTHSQLSALFKDNDRDPLSFSVVSKPSWVQWNANSSTLSMTSAEKPIGTHSMVVRATDPAGLSALCTLIFTVIDTNRAPIGSIPTRELKEGIFDSINYGQYISDPDNDNLIYGFNMLRIGDASDNYLGVPAGMTFNSTTGTLSGTPDYNTQGEYEVLITASDGKKSHVSSARLTIEHDVEPGLTDLEMNEGTTQSFSVSQLYPNAYPVEITLEGQPSFVSIGSNSRTLELRPDQTAAGNYSFKVTVRYEQSDQLYGASTASTGTTTQLHPSLIKTYSFSVNVNTVNVAPKPVRGHVVLSDVKNTNPWSLDLSRVSNYFTDADKDNLTLSIASKPSWMNWNSNTKTLSASSNAKPVGNHSIVVSATDPSGQSAQMSFQLRVVDSNRAPTGTLGSHILTEGRYASINYASYFSDPDGDRLTYRFAMLRAGDTSDNYLGVPAGMSFSSNGVLAGTPTYSTEGNYKVQITVSDGKKSHVSEASLTIRHGIVPVPVPRPVPVPVPRPVPVPVPRPVPVPVPVPVPRPVPVPVPRPVPVPVPRPVPVPVPRPVPVPVPRPVPVPVPRPVPVPVPRPVPVPVPRPVPVPVPVPRPTPTPIWGIPKPGGPEIMSFSALSAGVSFRHANASRLPKAIMLQAQSAPMASASVQPTATPTAKTNETESHKDTYWFTYDNNNRVVIDGGSLEENVISIANQGQYIGYNDAGQQKLVMSKQGKRANLYLYNSWGQVADVNKRNSTQSLYSQREELINSEAKSYWSKLSHFEYDQMGRVTQTDSYISSKYIASVTDGDMTSSFTLYYDDAISKTTSTKYNLAGEVTRLEEKQIDSDNISRILNQKANKAYRNGQLTANISAPWDSSSLSTMSISQDYDYSKVAGRLESYAYYQKRDLPSGVNQLIHNFSKTYTGRDHYLESKTQGKGSSSHKESQRLQDAETISSYDVNGNRTRVEEHITDDRYKPSDKKPVHARYMRYDAEGKLLSKVTGKQNHIMTSSDLVTGTYIINPRNGEPIDYTTTVAKNVGFSEDQVGDGKLAGSYYLYSGSNYLGEINKSGTNTIKENHFRAPDSNDASVQAHHQVRAGDTLKSIAMQYYGSEDLWYVLADANGVGLGSELTEGTMLDIPARANLFNSHDNFKPMNLGEVIGDTTPSMPYVPPPPQAGCNAVASIVMIAVAVVATIATAGAAAVAMGAASSSMGIMAAGTAALGGSLGAAGVAAAAIGGFAGSVASQLTGKAMGAVDSFSLKNAFASGLTAGATAGMGSALGAVKDGASGWHLAGRAAVQGTTTAISSVAANKLVGNRASFRWGNVAASALSSAITGDSGVIGQSPMNPITGIVNSGVRYGADKLFGNQASWNFGNVATDAFGNALGNSIVSGLSKSTNDNNTQAKTKQNGASSLNPDTGKFSPITDPDAWSLDKALAASQDDISHQNAQGIVNEELLNYELNRYYAGVDEFGFKLDENLVNMALPVIQKSTKDPFGGFLDSTPDNPYGLSLEQRARAESLAGNPLASADVYDALSLYEQQHYEMARDQRITSLVGPQLAANNPALEARRARARDYFVGSNNSPWHLPVSQGINDLGMAVGIWNKPLQFAKAYAGYQAADIAGSAYQNREQIAQIYNEAKQNGGMTLAVGVTPSVDMKYIQGAGALGIWGSVDFNSWDINGGGYFSLESGAAAKIINPSVDIGVEATVFSSARFDAALKGNYDVYGGGFNSTEWSWVKPVDQNFSGLQFTKDFNTRFSYSHYDVSYDPSLYMRRGWGTYFNVRGN